MLSLALHQDIPPRRAVTECAAYGSLLPLSEAVFHFFCFNVSGVLSTYFGNAFLSMQVFHFSHSPFYSKAKIITCQHTEFQIELSG
jgi:hypothetical protein